MRMSKSSRSILRYEIAGFGLLIAISWADEFLTSGVLGWGNRPEVRESVVETFAILAVGLVVVLLTRRVLSHLYFLEGFLDVCYSCERIRHEGRWIPVPDFFRLRFEVATSHGLCPDCFSAKFPGALPEAGKGASPFAVPIGTRRRRASCGLENRSSTRRLSERSPTTTNSTMKPPGRLQSTSNH